MTTAGHIVAHTMEISRNNMANELMPPGQTLNIASGPADAPATKRHSGTGAAVDKLRMHAFMIGNLGMLLNTEHTVCEVFDDLPLCRLPNSTAWLRGIANQRGKMVPIFDLHGLLDIAQPEQRRKQKFLVVGKGEDAVGMLIDQLPNRVVLSGNERLTFNPPLPERLQPFVRACYEIEKRIWIDWDISGFFHLFSEEVVVA